MEQLAGQPVRQPVGQPVGRPAHFPRPTHPRIYKEEAMKPHKDVRLGSLWDGLCDNLYDGLRGSLRTFLTQPVKTVKTVKTVKNRKNRAKPCKTVQNTCKGSPASLP